MKTFNYSITALAILLFWSCTPSSPKIDAETYSEFQQKGNEIAQLAQRTLLGNVGKAIQAGGPEYAVEFCNLQASAIIDSVNRENDCVISRITDKNRNTENKLKGQTEEELWEVFKTGATNDTLLARPSRLVYYKPIKVGMPACLKCHGNPETEIDLATLEKIQQLYPNDLATGYKLNDFRGLWKIEFSRTRLN